MADGKEPPSEAHPVAGPVAPATLKPASSRRSDFWAAALAVLFYALLVDVAVETFLSGSPVRWWVAATVAAFLVLTVGLWRLGGSLRSRFGWPARASTSFFLLLGLLAATAWMSEGLTRGVVVLRQPTSVVLSAATGIAVAFAGLVLIRVRALPWWGRAALGALAGYGLAAFVVGIVDATPYPSLFHGGSIWVRLPSWLQGTFIGAIVAVPLAIVARMIDARSAEGRVRGLQQGVALSLSVLMAASGFSFTAGPTVSVAAGDVSGSQLSEGKAGTASYTAAKGALEDRLSPLRRMYESTQWPASTAEEIGALLKHDPGACYAFIRSSLRYEPYQGVLRGARGALAAGGGNSADLSLLLRAMLQSANSPPMQFAVADLSPDAAAGLVDHSINNPPATANPTASLDDGSSAGTQPQSESATHGVQQQGAEFKRLMEAVRADRRQIEGLLAERRVGRAVEERAEAIAAVREHVWLQVRRDGQWQSLDPAAGLPLPEQGVRTMDELPAAWNHTVSLKIEVEKLEGARLERRQAFAHKWTTSELEGSAIDVGIAPDALSEDRLFAPDSPRGSLIDQARKGFGKFAIAVALTATAGMPASSFDLTGKVYEPASSGPTGVGSVDVFGRVKGLRPDTSNPTQLAGVWMTITLVQPDGTTRTVERALLDRVGAGARADGRVALAPAWLDAGATGLALVQSHQLLLPTGAIGAERPARAVLSGLAKEGLLEDALALKYPQAGNPVTAVLKKLKLPDLPGGLIQINDGALSISAATIAGSGVAYIAEPNLYVRSQMLVVRAGDQVRQQTLVDIAVNRVRVLGEPSQVADARVLHGLLISEMETAVAETGGHEPASASSAIQILRDAGKQGIEFQMVRSASDLARIQAGADAKAVMASQLQGAQALLAPVRPISIAGASRMAWWRLDLSGHVLAMGADGRGQAGTEGAGVLKEISIPSVKRTMKFTACLNEAIAGGGSLNAAGGACLSTAVYDTVKEALDAAIARVVSNVRKEAFGEEYDALLEKAKKAYELYEQREAIRNDPLGQAADRIPGIKEGKEASAAGKRIGAAFGFRLYLMLTMGREIAEFASKQ